MSSNIDLGLLLITAEFLVSAFFAARAGYMALIIRHALFVKMYRNQGLSISIAALATGILTLVGLVLSPASNQTGPASYPGDVLGPILLFGLYLGLFYTVDTFARVARHSDPLLRDTLHWSKVRGVVWAFDFLAAAYVVTLGLTTGQESIAFILPIVIPLVTGVLLFSMNARRVGDRTLRRHLSWLGPSFLLSFVGFFLAFGSGQLSGLAWIVATFCLYRSAGSLAPLHQIEPDMLGPQKLARGILPRV
jgi:hypothetical protein